VVEGDGGVSLTNDDAASKDKDGVKDELQAESSAEAPQ